MVERKRRIQREEEEDKLEEERIMNFKRLEGPAMRKEHPIPEGRNEAKKRKMTRG